MSIATHDLRDERPALKVDVVLCQTCVTLIPASELFDSWDTGADREACPRCLGQLLAP